MDRIDPLYYAHSDRIDLKEETRINTDSNEAEEWRQQNAAPGGKNTFIFLFGRSDIVFAAAPNFVSEIYYITLAMNHYGYQKTITTFEELARYNDDLARQIEGLEGDGSWRGVSTQCVLGGNSLYNLFLPHRALYKPALKLPLTL